MRLADFVASLPSGPPIPLKAGHGNYCDYVANGPDPFVAPSLRLLNGETTSSVVIVSAAGAFGKSTVAKYIASETKALLWDLGLDKRLASHALQGMLMSSFGGQGADEALKRMGSGDFLLVIDALDEARVKVTEDTFEDFISDIAAVLNSGSTSRPSVLLFGRSQVAEHVRLLLEIHGTPVGHMAIEPFDRDDALTYIERRMLSSREGAEARKAIETHPGEFRTARDTLLNRLGQAISATPEADWQDYDVRAFLGYAPVLDAVSVLLAQDRNYISLVNDLKTPTSLGGVATKPIAVLRRILERILLRESAEKLKNLLRPTLEGKAANLKWSAWETLYTPLEQCGRILARILNRPAPTHLPEGLPDQLRPDYEAGVKTWIAEHPFLVHGTKPANSVFKAFLFATGLLEGKLRSGEGVDTAMATADYKPSSLFADFYSLLRAELGHGPPVPAEHIGHLYASLAASENEKRRAEMDLSGVSPDEVDQHDSFAADCDLVIVDPTVDESEKRVKSRLSFQSNLGPDSQLRFAGSLRRASVITPGTVEIGRGASVFEIGPDVTIHAGKLNVLCESLVVVSDRRAKKDEATSKESEEQVASVVLEAESCTSALQTKPVVHDGPDALRVGWPGAKAFPWTDHVADAHDRGNWSPAMLLAFRRFRRIVLTLRSHSKGSLARLKDKVEGPRVLRGAVGEALLEKLKVDGVIKLHGNFYHWQPGAADKHVGVTWQKLRVGEGSARLEAYLRAFATQNAQLFARPRA